MGMTTVERMNYDNLINECKDFEEQNRVIRAFNLGKDIGKKDGVVWILNSKLDRILKILRHEEE